MGLTWCIVLTFLAFVDAEVALSVYKLSIVCQKEGMLVEGLERYVTNTIGNHSHVDKTIERFLEHVKEKRSGINDATEWVGHPINAYHLVERTANGWTKVKQSINCSTCYQTEARQDFLSLWNKVVEVDDFWASTDDVNIFATALWRLHETYNLDIKALMSGTIFNKSTFPLTSSDIISIASYLEVDNQIDWYEDYLTLGDVDERDSILYKLAMAYYMEDFPCKSLNILTGLQKSGSRTSSGSIIKIVRQKAESAGKDRPRKKRTSLNTYYSKIYAELCRGDNKPNLDTSTLRCYNKVTRIPYYTGKEEVLSNVPRISRFHDVISDAEISQIQDIIKPKLKPSTIFGKKGTYVTSRVSETYCNKDTQDIDTFQFQIKSEIPRSSKLIEPADLNTRPRLHYSLDRRVELLTGLDTLLRENTVASENLQVVNYGLGGHYLRHYDAFDTRKAEHAQERPFGDRIATWMFYLSSVEAGGATVFPKINLRAPPVKGSAIFWYNLLPSGDRDDRSQHAACPVVFGSKWITTKWILERAQIFRKPCQTHQMDEHDEYSSDN